ncbi:MAG TPA: PilZ domain-containing protein [Candidatus Dormibacteraeota bacterium]|nr:PilZ domain-containing protein [Candidatus Dormibacteraeota bacterium]
MNQDLRKTPRKKPERLVYIEFGSENGGMIRDLSENGMGFRSVGPLRPTEKVPFSFSFEGGEVLRGEAQLVWTDGDGRSGGLLFVNVSEEVRSKLQAWYTREMYQPGARPATMETISTASTFEELRNELRSQISPAFAGTSTAVTEIPAIQEKTGPAPGVAEAAQVRENVASRADAVLREVASSERATSTDIPSSVGTETGQTTPSEPPQPVESKTSKIGPVAASDPSPSVSQSSPPRRPSPVIAPLSFDRELNLGLESRPPLQGSLPEPTWVENLTVGWVLVAMLVLTLAAAAFVFRDEVGQSFIWLGAKISGSDQAAPVVQQPGVQQPAPPSTSGSSSAGQAENSVIDRPAPDNTAPRTNVPLTNVPPTNATGKTGNTPEKQKNQATPSAPNSNGPAAAKEGTVRTDDQAAGAGLGADNPLNASPSSASAGDDQNGQNALHQAMEILRADSRSTDIAEAVRLLWIAVEHGSSQAEVVLADLYRTGDGVAQSCDQTHILLTAAARKGNNEAKSRLVEIAHTGCP